MSMLKLLDAFDNPEAMEQLKKDFWDNYLKTWKRTEKEYCEKNHRPPVMDEQLMKEIRTYLEKCHTPFHIKALSEMVLVKFQVPNNFEDLDREANDLMTKALT